MGERTLVLPEQDVGGQKGWRLPSIVELMSLIDPAVAVPGPTLPPGHPFTNVLSSGYWTATTDAEDPTRAWLVDFAHGIAFGRIKTPTVGGGSDYVWSVRGAMQESVY